MPGTTGTPARLAAVRAAVLLPIVAIASGDGPMKVSPASRTAAANVLVLREEAVAGMHARRRPDCFAASINASMRR